MRQSWLVPAAAARRRTDAGASAVARSVSRWFAVGLCPLLGSGCSAPVACEQDGVVEDSVRLSSEPFSGSTVLEDTGSVELLDFRAELEGLPELWSDLVIVGSTSVSLRLAYQNEPTGSDGKTEMPRVRVSIQPNEMGAVPEETPSFPTAEGSSFSAQLFAICESGRETECCPYGAQACSLPVTVSMERLDGAPFPPIVVSWQVAARAVVATCPLGGDPQLSFAAEAP